MLRQRQAEPGLGTFDDIWPRNGAGKSIFTTPEPEQGSFTCIPR